ncbi:MAG: hypothetical protein FWE95_01180, partial [Planctomycetaceae bacterium]|nr:hypothetical protein [Planctomycetaceae bacterium]
MIAVDGDDHLRGCLFAEDRFQTGGNTSASLNDNVCVAAVSDDYLTSSVESGIGGVGSGSGL